MNTKIISAAIAMPYVGDELIANGYKYIWTGQYYRLAPKSQDTTSKEDV